MNTKKRFEKRLDDLRRRAERRLVVNQTDDAAPVADDAMQKILHDLHVHQIELEMQNEELREARQEAERSRDQFMALFHSAPVGYVVTDATGMIVQANLTFAQMIDHELAELFHQPLSSTIQAEDQAIFFSRFKAFYNNPAGKRLEVRLANRDGNSVHVAMEGRRTDPSGVSDDGNEMPQRLLITISDITQAKTAEKAIIRAKQQWEQTFDAVPDLIAIIDERRQVVRVNKALAQRLGTHPSACVGKRCFDLFHGDDEPSADCLHQQFLASGAPVEGEIFNRRLGGHFIVSVSPFHTDDPDARWSIHISHDVTDRKRAEKELLKLRNLESIGMLAGGIAHDFNNILMSLVGNIELAKLSLADPETSGYLDGALKSAFRARDLANRLLTFAKGGNPHLRPVTLEQLLEETLALCLCGGSTTHRLDLGRDLPQVVVDESQMKSAFQHIITNAREAMPWGGVLTIKVRRIAVAAGADPVIGAGEYLRIDFIDEGNGIHANHIEKVFDPYYTTKQMGAQKGMGLGLAISHSIISRHQGHITIHSESGRGCKVSVHLPLAQPAELAPATPRMTDAARQPGMRRRLLFMDDEKSIWDVIRPIFRQMECEVEFAADGETAIRMYRESLEAGDPYAALLLDLTIRGGMGATEVIQHLLALNPNVRAAVFSGYGTDPVFTDYRRFGFVGALQKPVQVEKLKSFVETVLCEN